MTTKIVVAFLATIFFIFAISLTVSAQLAPTADSLGVEEATGKSETDVDVPVKIVNVSNGPVQGIRFTVGYNGNVLTLTGISSGDLTSNWGTLQLGEDKHNVTMATFNTKDAIPNGSTGSVVLLKFHVIGSPGDTSPMNMVGIELSDPDGMVVGTAPASNGAFKVESSNGGGSSGNGGTGGGGGGSRYTSTPVPTSIPTPTEKPSAVSEDEREEVTEPHSPTLAPAVTPSATPAQTNASTTPELPAKANPILVIILIAVPIIAIISYVAFKHKKK